MKRKLLLIALTAMLLAALCATGALAADELTEAGGEIASGEYVLDGELTLTKDITISGEGTVVTIDLNGQTLRGTGSGSVISVTDGAVLNIQDSSAGGSGVITGGNDQTGGGIYVNGATLNMTGGAISGNAAVDGGGVYLTGGSSFTMTGGKISGNTLDVQYNHGHGGGVCVLDESTFKIISADPNNPAAISGNTAVYHGEQEGTQYRGGGIYAAGFGTRVEITNGLIDGNSSCTNSGYVGGGICATDGPVLIVRDSVISNNSAYIDDTNLAECHQEAGGGGISVCGNVVFEISNSKITGNTALYAAGIQVYNVHSAVITSCEITDNKALLDSSWGHYFNQSSGGGISYGYKTFSPPGGSGGSHGEKPEYELVITGTDSKPTVISGNSAKDSGGGIAITRSCTVSIDHTEISGNSAEESGGGIYLSDGEMTLSGGSISNNTADSGAGVYNNAKFTMSGGSITGNTAADWAGGVENFSSGEFTMTGGSINSNKATNGKSEDPGVGGGVTNQGVFTMTGGTLYGNTAAFAANDFYNHEDNSQALGVYIDDRWDSIHHMGIESMSASSSSGRAIEGGVFTLPDPATFNMGLDAWYHDGPDERYEAHPSNDSWVSFSQQTGEYFLTLGTPDPIESVTIKILDMVAYTGGDSLSERPFPEIRYQFTVSDPNVDVEKINFTIFNKEYSLKHNIDLGIAEEVSNGVYIIHASDIEGAFELPVIFTLGGVEAEDDSEPGEYVIDLSASARELLENSITAEYEGRDITEV